VPTAGVADAVPLAETVVVLWANAEEQKRSMKNAAATVFFIVFNTIR